LIDTPICLNDKEDKHYHVGILLLYYPLNNF